MLSTLQVHQHSFSDPGKPDEDYRKPQPLRVHSDRKTTSTDIHLHSSTDLINMSCHGIVTDIAISLSYWHTLKTAHARQEYSPQGMFYSSAPSSEK